jgi:hypothetical protein
MADEICCVAFMTCQRGLGLARAVASTQCCHAIKQWLPTHVGRHDMWCCRHMSAGTICGAADTCRRARDVVSSKPCGAQLLRVPLVGLTNSGMLWIPTGLAICADRVALNVECCCMHMLHATNVLLVGVVSCLQGNKTA